jgi:hypothetical protein
LGLQSRSNHPKLYKAELIKNIVHVRKGNPKAPAKKVEELMQDCRGTRVQGDQRMRVDERGFCSYLHAYNPGQAPTQYERLAQLVLDGHESIRDGLIATD